MPLLRHSDTVLANDTYLTMPLRHLRTDLVYDTCLPMFLIHLSRYWHAPPPPSPGPAFRGRIAAGGSSIPAMLLRARYAIPAMLLRARYAIPGTDMGHLS
eukprot:3936035-Rhodomonas_salina.1